MSKFRVLFGLTVMIGLLAISASSASAFFSSANNGTATQGKGTAGSTTFTDEGASVTCTSAEGTWKLATAKQSKTVNIHVNASFAKPAGWKGCKSSLGEAEVSECELQVKQVKSEEHKGLGSVVKGCEVKASGCTITVPPGSGGSNENLKEIFGENSGSNLKSKVNVEGITSEAKGGIICELGGITNAKNKVGKEKGEVLGELLKEV